MYSAYPAKFTPDDNGTLMVSFPDVPQAVTDVADKASANPRAAEALAAALSFYVEADRPLPVPSSPKRGQMMIHLGAGTIAKLALYTAMREQDVTQAELARRLGCHRQQAARIVDPAHNTKFEYLEAALAAVGLRVAVSIERTAA
ncbi:MAG: helix-turn-helix transcriptional regulator [Acidobacteria bacterium]|nr:helix-turn-helix transcriptional regulator [Acidobacteriota bacterium]